MARNLDPKCKQCRREGVKLFLKGERCLGSKCALIKRNYVPGVHGPKLGRGGRLTGYGTQLREKQKAKRTYLILERQFKKYFDMAIKKRGDTGKFLFQLLERRLDNVVFRAGMFLSRGLARQFVLHGHFLINGKKVDIPSYQVKVKEKISIAPSSLKKTAFQGLAEKMKGKELSDWLVFDPAALEITVVDSPDLEKSPTAFDLKQIIEFYSR
ncbi:30S ribosomal protein S4 [Candidatus Falkowbacteria bacterium]|nr:30S ribosomal protein S4 [Candidatus Falkowbacteria bacterium]